MQPVVTICSALLMPNVAATGRPRRAALGQHSGSVASSCATHGNRSLRWSPALVQRASPQVVAHSATDGMISEMRLLYNLAGPKHTAKERT